MRTPSDSIAAAQADLLPVAEQVRGAYARLREAEAAAAHAKHVHWRHLATLLGGRPARAQAQVHTHTHPVPTV